MDTVYDFNGGRCWDPKCNEVLNPPNCAVWLCDDFGTAYPFHEVCADSVWPLYEVDPPDADC